MLDVPSTEGLGLACESTGVALILIRCAASATSRPAPTALCKNKLAFVFVFASGVVVRPSEFEDGERFMLRPNEGTAAEHNPVWPVHVFRAEPPVRWPPKDGQPKPMLQKALAQGAGSPAANGRTAGADATQLLLDEPT